jgi:hypothetical protein
MPKLMRNSSELALRVRECADQLTPIPNGCCGRLNFSLSPIALLLLFGSGESRPKQKFRVSGQGCTPDRPFPLRPQIPAGASSSAALRTILLDHSEHLLHNQDASVASLRLLFTFATERRSPSLWNRRSPSSEYPDFNRERASRWQGWLRSGVHGAGDVKGVSWPADEMLCGSSALPAYAS